MPCVDIQHFVLIPGAQGRLAGRPGQAIRNKQLPRVYRYKACMTVLHTHAQAVYNLLHTSAHTHARTLVLHACTLHKCMQTCLDFAIPRCFIQHYSCRPMSEFAGHLALCCLCLANGTPLPGYSVTPKMLTTHSKPLKLIALFAQCICVVILTPEPLLTLHDCPIYIYCPHRVVHRPCLSCSL
jgi:hypothetical protein